MKPWYKRRRYWLHGLSAMVGAMAVGWSQFVQALPGPQALWMFAGMAIIGLNASLAQADRDDDGDDGGDHR